MNEDCEQVWVERSALAEGADCDECGESAIVVDSDEEPFDEEPSLQTQPTARLVHARQMASAALTRHGIAEPLIDVVAIAAAEGFEVRAKRLAMGLSGHRPR